MEMMIKCPKVQSYMHTKDENNKIQIYLFQPSKVRVDRMVEVSRASTHLPVVSPRGEALACQNTHHAVKTLGRVQHRLVPFPAAHLLPIHWDDQPRVGCVGVKGDILWQKGVRIGCNTTPQVKWFRFRLGVCVCVCVFTCKFLHPPHLCRGNRRSLLLLWRWVTIWSLELCFKWVYGCP